MQRFHQMYLFIKNYICWWNRLYNLTNGEKKKFHKLYVKPETKELGGLLYDASPGFQNQGLK